MACAAVVAAWVWMPSPEPIALSDMSNRVGITFHHTDGGCGQRFIMETVTAGLALFDYDGDGRIDIYFVNGAPLGGRGPEMPRNALYRNLGDWRFVDVTDQAGYNALYACYDEANRPFFYLVEEDETLLKLRHRTQLSKLGHPSS